MAEIEVYEVLCLCQKKTSVTLSFPERKCGKGFRTVGDEASEVAANDAVPCGSLALVKRLLDVLSDILPPQHVSYCSSPGS